MKPAPISEKLHQAKLWLLGFLFLTLIYLPTLDWLLHLDRAPMSNEKRMLVTFPKFGGLAHLQEFIAGLESYFNDHFGYRKRLVRTQKHWKRQLFRGVPDRDVVVGRDGWLFFVGDRMLDRFFGLERFSEQDLRTWQRVLEKRRDWAARRGIKYLFVLAPNKHSIYPEYLPDWLVKSPKPDNTEQFMAYMKAHSTVEVLDLRPALLEAKSLGVSYLKTDTHWNFLGGFVAYQAVVRALARQVPGLTPLPLEAFERKVVLNPLGDLGEVLADSKARETQMIVLEPRPPLRRLQQETVPWRLPYKWLKGGEPTVSRSPSGQGKVIVFRESYAGGFQPFLGYHFKEVLYIWLYNWNVPFLEREKPGIIVDELVEHYFSNMNPADLLKQDALD